MSHATPRLHAHGDSLEGASEHVEFDYTEAAELFTHMGMIAPPRSHEETPADNLSGRARMNKRRGITYRRFASGAEAVRFAMEELSQTHLRASVLVAVGGDRYEAAAIKDLYTSCAYPLARTSGKRVAGGRR